ncbi:hypothetical protein VTP01DRAFT_1556 [Rhizomucor pusillus]|uniref:uncharacterized protein n=1 Tax=Rhizomucor pusillus TaxID=4840 RepID=UPI00374209E3
MTKQQRLSWASPAHQVTHHHRHHRRKDTRPPQYLYPLHRSITDEESYADKPSPITRFVSKLLGLTLSSQQQQQQQQHRQKRPPFAHKSHSTTSITKGSVISAASSIYKNQTDYCDSSSSSSSSEACTPSSPAVDALVSAVTQHNEQQEERRSRQQRLVGSLDIMDPPKLINRREDTEPVLSAAVAEQLRPYLPRRYRLASQWSLLYSLDQHGTSLATLYRLVKANKGPCILAIKDAEDHVFGAFLNETLKANLNSYYGTGECFLWKVCRSGNGVKVYPWTGKNEYMILSEADFIAIGGGDGKFGLWINSDLERGHSEPCPTFDNEALSSHSEFACIELEVWGFRI